MANGLLFRVGIDSESGKWNGPCRANGDFCYIPIPEGHPSGFPFDRTYEEFAPFVTALGGNWPDWLVGPCHLDPDFAHLTYGDGGSRAQRILDFMVPGSFIVFWAGLRYLDGETEGDVVCSIIGFFKVSHVLRAEDVGKLDWHRNAHTRRFPGQDFDPSNIIVFANPSESGRFHKHIPIGEFRDRAQRVDPEILDAWGGLCKSNGEPIQDGYIQRSGNPPIFTEPKKFLRWLKARKPKLVHANNICPSV